jgi:hypothetical protein
MNWLGGACFPVGKYLRQVVEVQRSFQFERGAVFLQPRKLLTTIVARPMKLQRRALMLHRRSCDLRRND